MRALWLAGILCAPAAAQETPPAAPDRDDALAALAPGIARAIRRADSAHPVFHGCLDWHSAVHGHWALFRIARVTGRHDDEADAADRALTPDGLQAEAAYLRDHPEFERPYGRAWFLRLAIDFEHWAASRRRPDPRRLRPMADEVASALLAHFEGLFPGPRAREYGNTSWTFAQLHAYCRLTGDEARLRTVRDWIRKCYVDAGPRTLRFADDARTPEFFSRYGNWAYLIARTQDAATLKAFLAAHPAPDGDLRPVDLSVMKGEAHAFGMNWSRAWALRALSRAAPDESDRARFARACDDHVRIAMRDHDAYREDYMAYGHWVPQFAVYALTEGEVEE